MYKLYEKYNNHKPICIYESEDKNEIEQAKITWMKHTTTPGFIFYISKEEDKSFND